MKLDINNKIRGSKCTTISFESNDKQVWKNSFDSYMTLCKSMDSLGARRPNLLEGISETAFCLLTNSIRVVKGHECDIYNIKDDILGELKATTIDNDLTSFSPTSKGDKLYFMDFYNNGNLNGSFDIYDIDYDLIENLVLNKKENQTFKDQQKQGRRPRLGLKKVIKEHSIKPIYKDVDIIKL